MTPYEMHAQLLTISAQLSLGTKAGRNHAGFLLIALTEAVEQQCLAADTYWVREKHSQTEEEFIELPF